MDSWADEREFVYDAVVVSVSGLGASAVTEFRAPDDRTYVLRGELARAIGEIGLLRAPGPFTRHATFIRYADQRLRRWPARDRRGRGAGGFKLLGWRLMGVRGDPILVREGIIPGIDGSFIPDRRETVKLWLPYEFLELCEGEGVSPQDALAAFAADVCNLQSSHSLPREDGRSSSAANHVCLAQRYFSAVHGLSNAWRSESEVV